MADKDPADLKVWTGRHVELLLRYTDGALEQLSLDVVPDEAADFAAGFLGESTPLAKAIAGQTANTVIAYRAGDIDEVRILSVAAELRSAPRDLSQRREEVTRKAVRSSDHTSLIIYASSMNSKWGNYDPEGLQEDGEES